MTTLNGKFACITGGSSGMGRALALALAREGCEVCLVARHQNDLEQTAARIEESTGKRAVYCASDISCPDQIGTIAAKCSEFGQVDILINAASGFSEDDLDTMSAEEITSMMDTTARGTLLVTKALLPHLKRSGDAHVVNFVSDWALPGKSGPTPFAAAKWAVAGMGESLARELIPYGIKVLNIFPGDTASMMDPDASVSDVVSEYGQSMIPLSDIVSTVLHALTLDGSRIQSVVILPTDPAYVE